MPSPEEIAEAIKLVKPNLIHHPSDYCPRCGHGYDCRAYYECRECDETSYASDWMYCTHKAGCSLIPAQEICCDYA